MIRKLLSFFGAIALMFVLFLIYMAVATGILLILWNVLQKGKIR